MSRVLLAPDKFKGTLTAAEVAGRLAAGIRSVVPSAAIDIAPMADGGDGTLMAAEAAGFTRIPLRVTGPTGAPLWAAYARRGTTAIVELAAVSGLARLPAGHLAPLTATSRGTGEAIAAALDAGASQIVVGLGGSASTDGGAGLLEGLGARITERGRKGLPGGAALADATHLDVSRLHPGLARCELIVACDVDNPLTGPHGAAAVYGPQKGATPVEVAQLDGALSAWAGLIAAVTGRDQRGQAGAGAAGGVGFALLAVLGARMRPGAELVAELVGLPAAVSGADLVVTGEGSLDEQTLHGKAPAAVAALARKNGVPAVAVAGRVALGSHQLQQAGFSGAYALLDEVTDECEAFERPGPLLERIGGRLARKYLGRSMFS